MHAIVRVYSAEGESAIAKWVGANVRILADEVPTWRLVHVHWRPPPTKNEWNTEHDFRKMLARMMGDLWYDIVLADYKWKAVPDAE